MYNHSQLQLALKGNKNVGSNRWSIHTTNASSELLLIFSRSYTAAPYQQYDRLKMIKG